MSCQEIQQALSLYVDDQLPPLARGACEEHLRECPVCRTELAELRNITRSLAALPRPVPAANLASSIKYSLKVETSVRMGHPVRPLGVRLMEWLKPRLMPYTVGTFASLLLFTALFNGMRPHLQALDEAAIASRQEKASYRIVLLRGDQLESNQLLTPELYATQRSPFNNESPSLNPRGALAALTRSRAHGNDESEGDDDMIVITDVFSNGRASLAEVVQPPRDRRMLDEFQIALQKNAAFVPSSYDNRPEAMRIVFVVQRVDVPERNF
ncbi:MAG TPA: zf-HC2 domain-containing protein [Pyrinomonadaceae bacterium]